MTETKIKIPRGPRRPKEKEAKKPADENAVAAELPKQSSKAVAKVPTKRSNAPDTETEAMIYDGLNLTQLAKLFRMERRMLSPKLREINSCGERNGYPIYFVHEIAPHVVKPVYENIEQYIMRMNHNDLPKTVLKEFWTGMKARQEYMITDGDLWPTDDVIAVLGETFKTLRMSLLLMTDAIERESTLSSQQRDRLRGMVDGALNDLADSLINRFEVEALVVSEEDQEDDEL